MRSSTGVYFRNLDHVRAVAIFLVFTWHFIHHPDGRYIPFGYVPEFFPLSLLSEGNTGVALFMVLSGYLFAKITRGQDILFGHFLLNRALRLVPLLLAVIGLYWLLTRTIWAGSPYPLADAVKGIVLPTWPNGGWSIAVEIHFYALFPLLRLLGRKHWAYLAATVPCMIVVRYILWRELETVFQDLAYATIVGRIDQFVLGMLASEYAASAVPQRTRAIIAAAAFVAFAFFWQRFTMAGGLKGTSASGLWVVIPTIEGVTYALIIAWYDGARLGLPSVVDGYLALVGDLSYSIYLLHPFVNGWMADHLARAGVPLIHFGVAVLLSWVALMAMLPIAGVSYFLYEKRFLDLKVSYMVPRKIAAPPAMVGA